MRVVQQGSIGWTVRVATYLIAVFPGVSHSFCVSYLARHSNERIIAKKGICLLGYSKDVEGTRHNSYDEDLDSSDKTRRLLVGSFVASASIFGVLQSDSSPAWALSSILTAASSEEESRIAVFEKAAQSVVFIDTFTERRDAFSTNVMEVPLGSGSGFIWDKDGHIVTNYHVVRNAKSAQVAILTDGKALDAMKTEASSRLGDSTSSMPVTSTMRRPSNGSPFMGTSKQLVFLAQVVGVDPGKDIAVLKVDAPKSLLRPLTLGSSKGLKVGQESLAIGNPFGLDHTLTSGIISGLGREVKSPIGRPITNVIQTDAAINPGNSGGPLLDSSGRLVGMNTAIYSPSGASAGIGFAIPIDTVKYIVETLIADGRVIRPVLGISYLESRQAKTLGISSGVLVLDVPPDSPPAKAGLRGTRRSESGLIELGDIIVQVGDTVIDTESDLFQAVENYKPGDFVQVTVQRIVASQDELITQRITLTVPLQSSAIYEIS